MLKKVKTQSVKTCSTPAKYVVLCIQMTREANPTLKKLSNIFCNFWLSDFYCRLFHRSGRNASLRSLTYLNFTVKHATTDLKKQDPSNKITTTQNKLTKNPSCYIFTVPLDIALIRQISHCRYLVNLIKVICSSSLSKITDTLV